MPAGKHFRRVFKDYGLSLSNGPATALQENEACWLKEDQHENGDWMSYRLSARRDGIVHSVKVSRHEYLAEVASGNGEEYMRGLIREITLAN